MKKQYRHRLFMCTGQMEKISNSYKYSTAFGILLAALLCPMVHLLVKEAKAKAYKVFRQYNI